MNNADMPATPMFNNEAKPCIVRDPETKQESAASGLTKREHFAAMAMQGILAAKHPGNEAKFSRWAVECADALLKTLETKEEGQ